MLISEAHALMGPQGHGMPCIATVTPLSRSAAVATACFDELVQAWGAFNNLPVKRYTKDGPV